MITCIYLLSKSHRTGSSTKYQSLLSSLVLPISEHHACAHIEGKYKEIARKELKNFHNKAFLKLLEENINNFKISKPSDKLKKN